MNPEDPITELLHAVLEDNPAALDELMTLVYGNLKSLAVTVRSRVGGIPTMQPSTILHETYLRLFPHGKLKQEVRDRKHFTAVVRTMMRYVTLDYRRYSTVRGAGLPCVHADDQEPADPRLAGLTPVEMLTLERLIEKLAGERHPRIDYARQAEVLMARAQGWTLEEIAERVGKDVRTVKRDFQKALANVREYYLAERR